MSNERKKIDIGEFIDAGFLQEVNRQFFHPLGLALEVTIDPEGIRLNAIWDYRDDPEGMTYKYMGPEAIHKALCVERLRQEKALNRLKTLGYIIQPLKRIL